VRPVVTRSLFVLAVGLLAGCSDDNSTPTSLDVTVSVEGEALVTVPPNACHVRGTIVNATADLTANVTMRWQAFDAADATLGFTKLVVRGVPPATQAIFESTGFASNDRGLIGCDAIARFERIETIIERS
jgi:hypothetical protein